MLDEFFKIALNLKAISRQGWIDKVAIKNPESVADHSFGTIVMAMVFGDYLDLDTTKMLKMAILHDLAESITGDLTPDSTSKSKKEKLENEAMHKILKELPEKISDEYLQIWNEYQQQKSNESSVIHQIDKLEMAFQAIAYRNQGYSTEKLKTFLDSANEQINQKEVQQVLSDIIKKDE